jgi:acetyl-CoA acetyltransferase
MVASVIATMAASSAMAAISPAVVWAGTSRSASRDQLNRPTTSTRSDQCACSAPASTKVHATTTNDVATTKVATGMVDSSPSVTSPMMRGMSAPRRATMIAATRSWATAAPTTSRIRRSMVRMLITRSRSSSRNDSLPCAG